jgi:hypothetical protein
MAREESQETPAYEARHHPPSFLREAARMAEKKEGRIHKARKRGAMKHRRVGRGRR